jgi:hypothetical protein
MEYSELLHGSALVVAVTVTSMTRNPFDRFGAKRKKLACR